MASAPDDALDTQAFRNIKKTLLEFEVEAPESPEILFRPQTEHSESTDHLDESPIKGQTPPGASLDMTKAQPRYPALESTQPIETQVYEEFYTTRAQSSKATGNTNGTRATYGTDDTGFVDLVSNFAGNETADQDEAPDGAPTDTQPGMFGQSLSSDGESEDELAIGSQAQSTPGAARETPGFAGKKRDHDGNFVSSINRTPAPNYAAMFPGMQSKGVVGLSQVFHDTQADSSPTSPANIRSDPVFDRPSPMFDRALRSTPALTNSSPALGRKPGRSLSTTEPRSAYQPVDESQRQRELRKRKLDLQSTPSNSLGRVEWDDEDDELDLSARHRRTQDRLKGFRDFSELRASAHSHSTRKRKFTASETAIGLVSAKRETPRGARHEVIHISSDHGSQDSSDDSSNSESQDEYDEYSQKVIPSERSDAKLPSPDKPRSAVKSLFLARPTSSPMRGRYGGIEENPPLHARPVSDVNRQRRADIDRHRESKLPAKRTTNMVANSQPENDSQYSIVPPRPFLPSSIPSKEFISQSQLASLSSNTRRDLADLPDEIDADALDTSSIPPAPELDSSPPPAGNNDKKQVESPSSSPFRVPSSTKAVTRSSREGFADDKDRRADQAPTTVSRSGRPLSNPTIPETSPANTAPAQQLKSRSEDTSLNTGSSKPSRSEAGTDSAGALINTNSDNFQTAPSQPSKPSSSSYTRNRTPLRSGQFQKSSSFASPSKKAPTTSPRPSQTDALQAVDLEQVNIMGAEEMDFHTAMSNAPREAPTAKRSRKSNDRSKSDTAVMASTAPSLPGSPLLTRSRIRSSQAPPLVSRPRDTRSPVQPSKGKLKRLRSVGVKIPAPTRIDTVVQRSTDQPIPSVHASPEVPATDIPSPNHLSPQTTKHHAILDHEGVPEELAQEKISNASPQESQTPRITAETDVAQPQNPTLAAGEIKVPNRVWACFRGIGNSPTFFPATSIGQPGPESSGYRIQFDDGVIDTVEAHLVRSLDLQIGDMVKVDMTGLRKLTYSITGFKDVWKSSTSAGNDSPKTDIRGYTTVVLEPKQHRESLSHADKLHAPQPINIPITSLYVTSTLWPRFEQRGIGQSLLLQSEELRVRTPVLQASEPSTPSTRSRRQTMTSVVTSAINLANTTSDTKEGMFSNMAFAISYSSSKESDRKRITKLIQQNGGQILSDGFEKLFDTEPMTVERKEMTLKSAYETLGFVALIADTHSRRTKYMQALALNIPCLAGRWILDCVAQKSLHSWSPYLLAAGESTYLDGVVRSRILSGVFAGAGCDAYTTTRASAIVEHRSRLIESKSVILLAFTGRGNKNEERSKTFTFLGYALGAKRVVVVKDEKKLRSRLDEGGWDIVCVDDARVEEVRDRVDVEVCKVVGHAYVVQSLILGALVDE